MGVFQTLFDSRDEKFKPLLIEGSGSLHETVIWVNLRNALKPEADGEVLAGINNWVDFFAVRYAENVNFDILNILRSFQTTSEVNRWPSRPASLTSSRSIPKCIGRL